ncbi:hypothetical protein C8R44DRAFT_892214 [Mycena epipterygia]|nr:hypothetical protein C8R44DRAFT_892214 [Mycena epipterygia]
MTSIPHPTYPYSKPLPVFHSCIRLLLNKHPDSGPGRRSPSAIRLCQGDGDALRPRRVRHRSQLASFSRLHTELPAAAAVPVWAADAATSARTLQLEYHSEWHNNIDTNNTSSASNTGPPPPLQRKWFDAYWAHNGLIPEAMWADASECFVKFVSCPNMYLSLLASSSFFSFPSPSIYLCVISRYASLFSPPRPHINVFRPVFRSVAAVSSLVIRFPAFHVPLSSAP